MIDEGSPSNAWFCLVFYDVCGHTCRSTAIMQIKPLNVCECTRTRLFTEDPDLDLHWNQDHVR